MNRLAALLLAGGLLATLASGAPAAAQVAGLYYQEIEKDGRIYLFNTPERYQSFQESGEMGTAISLIGQGENGETLVAENETAIDLYLFKHGLPGYERPTPKPQKKFDEGIFYKDGKTNIVMKSGRVAISNRVQARYTYSDPDGADSVGTFRIRRMKTTIEGSAYDDKVRFKLQGNWVGGGTLTSAALAGSTLTTRSARTPVLEDAELWYAFDPLATLWVGQGKATFGRQELTSSGKQQFVDRSIASGRFAPGRDVGVALLGANAGRTFEYNLGIYNGNGINTTTNDNDEYMTVGRAVWTPFGEVKLEESALDYPDRPRLALGAGFLRNTTGTGASATDIARLGAELAFKLHGFNVVGEYYQEEAEATATGVETDADGYYVQAGYLLPNRKLEIAGRLSEILPDTAADTDVTESGVAVSWYFDKHNHKLQADYLKVEDAGRGTETNELRLQLQLIF